MNSFEGPEKRGLTRTPLTTFCPATFAYDGHEYEVLMSDLNEKGAGFKFEHPQPGCRLKSGDVLSLKVRTPYGKSACTGRVVWADEIDGQYVFGIVFTSLSTDPADPLVSFIDSAF
jgi:hypothetical protein